MWIQLYADIKKYLAQGKEKPWIISTIENSREMKTTYHPPMGLIATINFIAGKAAEERAIANGDISAEGGLYFSVAGGEG